MKKFVSKEVRSVLGQITGFSEYLPLIEIWRKWEKRSTSDSLLSLPESFLRSSAMLSENGNKKRKQQERWKQRKQGYRVIYFVKSHLPHITKREGGVGEKFSTGLPERKGDPRAKRKGKRPKNESKLDVVKSDGLWPTQTLKK